MKNKILFLLVTFCLTAQGQIREQLSFNDLYRENLRGKVKELTKIEYEPVYKTDGKFDLEVKWIFLIANNYTEKFNRLGYKIEQLEISKHKDSLLTTGTWKYEYDSSNRILRENYDKLHSRWDYIYIGDSITKITKTDLSNYYKPEYYIYTQRGNKELLKNYIDSNYIYKRIYTYDKSKRIIRHENFENKDSIQDIFMKAYSDRSSKKVKSFFYKRGKNEPVKYSYEYDKNNNVIKEIKTMSSKTITKFYEYVYDTNSNWIESKEFDTNHKLLTVTKREISYYD